MVPLDALLAVMAEDSAPVAQRIHRLLLPSYFPGPEQGVVCVAALLRQSPEVPSSVPMHLRLQQSLLIACTIYCLYAQSLCNYT